MSKMSVRDIYDQYREGTPLTMLTAYDAPTARQVDGAGVDMILVGDSAGDNHLGYDDTLPVTMDEAISNTAAVSRAVEEALVIGDMPFMSYGASVETSVENAGRFLKSAGADAVKIETAPLGETTISLIRRLTELGVPVQGHIGFTPQREGQIGGTYVQGRDHPSSVPTTDLVETAERLEDAGVFSLVLETVTEETAKQITEQIDIPTIGIGAGRYVNGQVLVVNDVLGFGGKPYSLSKQYVDLDDIIHQAVSEYVDDVRQYRFPAEEHTFDPIEE